MTDVTQRPRPTVRPANVSAEGVAPLGAAAVRPLPLSTVLAALAVAAGGLVLAVGLAVIGSLAVHDGSIGGVARVGAAAWLAGHGAPPQVGGVPLGLVPLGVPLLVLAAARWAGRWALGTSAPPTQTGAACSVGAAGLAYGLVAAGLALTAVPDGVVVDPLRAGVVAGLLVAAGVGAGLAPGLRLVSRASALLPVQLLTVVRGALAALLTLLSLSALTLLATLVGHGSDVIALGQRLAPGLVGGSLLVLVCLLFLPNALLWSAAYVLGPGFMVGSGSLVSSSGVVLGPLPAYPPLAALPAPGDQPAWASLLLLLPLVAGAVGGIVAERQSPGGRWWLSAAQGAGAGALAGAVLAGLLMVAGGAVGPGRLAETGPLPLAGVLAVGSLGLAGLLGALGTRVFGGTTGAVDRLAAWLPRLPWGHR